MVIIRTSEPTILVNGKGSPSVIAKTLFPKVLMIGTGGGQSYESTLQISSIQLSNDTANILINPTSVIPSLDIIMPINPEDMQEVNIQFGGTIPIGDPVVTALTISPSAGQSIYQSLTPSEGKGGDNYRYKFDSNNSTWRRL